MKKIKLIICWFIMAAMLCSCNISSFDTDTLITPPQMNTVNNQILKSISSAIGNSYELIYPSKGNYQTAIVSVELTGDNYNEAVCFYTEGNDKTASFIVLESNIGSWSVKSIFKSQATDVDQVEFCDINGDGLKEIIIGWQYLSGEEKALEILGFGSETEMESVYTGMYNSFITFEDSVVTISKNTSGKTASATLIGSSAGRISILGTVSLNNSISAFVSIKSSVIENGRQSIYLDEQLESLLYTTEVLTVNKNEITVTPEEISAKTSRTRACVCTDIDNDGDYEIPFENSLPPYDRNGVTENLVYIDWYSYDGVQTEYINSGYVSVTEQFYFRFPQEWRNKITVQRSDDSDRAVNFYMQAKNDNVLMFSIRVFSQQEFTDKTKELGWQSITTANENVYAYRLDNTTLPENFKTDIQIITERFSLIS